MALTIPQVEQHAGRLLRQILTHIEPDVAQRVLDPLATALLNAGKAYVLNGTIGTQPERREAMIIIGQTIYAAILPVNPNDGARGQHGYENHWMPSKERGE